MREKDKEDGSNQLYWIHYFSYSRNDTQNRLQTDYRPVLPRQAQDYGNALTITRSIINPQKYRFLPHNVYSEF